jgi:uncharacterized protein
MLIYTRQRMLACIACEVLRNMGFAVIRKGDDIFYREQKLSVSIASASPVSSKIHFGMNVRCDEYMSLEKMGIKDPIAVMKEIGKRYSMEIDDIEKDIRKSRPLEVFGE